MNSFIIKFCSINHKHVAIEDSFESDTDKIIDLIDVYG